VEELLFAKHINYVFVKPATQPQFMVGLIKIKLCFLFNQTAISVAAGKPHPHPQYQTAT
jgi:hypothetical protein